MTVDFEEQYDKIYRYCYFKLRHRELAEDITQETFLRFLESNGYENRGKSLAYLYTIACHLCIDEYRKKQTVPIENAEPCCTDDNMLTSLALKMALSQLEETEKELLLLRYVNDVPLAVICKLYRISRFSAYRRIKKAAAHLEANLGKEEFV